MLDDAGNVVGILAAKDLTAASLAGKSNGLENIAENLRTPLVVPSTLLISSLLARMRSTRRHMATVINEHGTYVGIVTPEDLLEEIVGEIEDEWDIDTGSGPIEAVDSGWRANGQLSLAELESTLGYSFPDADNVTTLGGLIMSRLERLPEEGDRLEEGPFEFTVSRMDGRRVGIAMIRKLKPD